MERQNDRGATWPAIYFIRQDLKHEKMQLITAMTELTMHYWGGTDPITDSYLQDISDRIDVINRVIYNIETANYCVEDDE